MLHIVFMLNDEEYGIEIYYAQEIIRIPNQIIQVPNMPSYVKGVINLRGQVIPVIDLKERFGFEKAERNIDNRLIVINLKESVLSFIVDDISEIIEIKENSIEKLDSVMTKISKNSITGIGKIDKRLILLLDVSKLNSEVFQESIGMEE